MVNTQKKLTRQAWVLPKKTQERWVTFTQHGKYPTFLGITHPNLPITQNRYPNGLGFFGNHPNFWVTVTQIL